MGMLNEHEVARILGVSSEDVVEAIKNGELEAKRSLDGNEWTITPEALNSYQRKQEHLRTSWYREASAGSSAPRYRYIRFYQGFNTFVAAVILAITLVLALAAFGLYPEGGLIFPVVIGVIGFLGYLFQMVWSDVIQVALDMEEHMRMIRRHTAQSIKGDASSDVS